MAMTLNINIQIFSQIRPPFLSYPDEKHFLPLKPCDLDPPQKKKKKKELGLASKLLYLVPISKKYDNSTHWKHPQRCVTDILCHLLSRILSLLKILECVKQDSTP